MNGIVGEILEELYIFGMTKNNKNESKICKNELISVFRTKNTSPKFPTVNGKKEGECGHFIIAWVGGGLTGLCPNGLLQNWSHSKLSTFLAFFRKMALVSTSFLASNSGSKMNFWLTKLFLCLFQLGPLFATEEDPIVLECFFCRHSNRFSSSPPFDDHVIPPIVCFKGKGYH